MSNFKEREKLIFELGSEGKAGVDFGQFDLPLADPAEVLGADLARDEIEGFPQVSEVEVVRHFTRLSLDNYCIDHGLFPLGSCTMKYNPKINDRMAALPAFRETHPMAPDELCQGNLEAMWVLEQALKGVTGMDAVSLQPAAGAQGELTGMLMVRAYHEAQGNPRKRVLIPDSAHGTNPASAAICGYQVTEVGSGPDGRVDLESLKAELGPDVAAMMITNPNTLGIFESRIHEIADLLHEVGAFLYMDGANMNALMGYVKPAETGVDVLHLNLHKTFSTPHGGGGPGAGPVGVVEKLAPYLPSPVVKREELGEEIRYSLDYNRPDSIGKVHGFYGNFGILLRALSYILAYGPGGLKLVTETAVLNANYLRNRLAGTYHLPFSEPSFHEVILSDKNQEKTGARTLDIAKRLIDYGFHPPTIYFPLIVPGALMIEPTETENRDELDRFVDAMLAISRECEENPDEVKSAPHQAAVRRLDEARAARKPVLRWVPDTSED